MSRTGKGTALFLLLFAASVSYATVPTVKVVPWIPANPTTPHDTFAGRTVTLKGTTDVQGSNFEYKWDFGDGNSTAFQNVTNKYNLGVTKLYAGAVGTIYTATLTVRDKTTGETGTAQYYVKMQTKTLQVEVNVAIDEGLWYLHTTQCKDTGNDGQWNCGGYAASGYYGATAANVNAFLTNGHGENGSASNPYTDTVRRGIKFVLSTALSTRSVSAQVNPKGTVTADGNGNGYAIYVPQSETYQGGIVMDMLLATGTPNAVANYGPAFINGRSYRDIVQDLADNYAYCQVDSGYYGGGWRYGCNGDSDNSAAQWAAIGLIPAQQAPWNIVVSPALKQYNADNWLVNSQGADGRYGYTSSGDIWGPFATTPSGMVQLAFDGIGRGDARWDKAETFMRENFDNATASGATVSVKSYYYGMYALVKALLTAPGGPYDTLVSTKAVSPKPPIHWYDAEAGVSGATSDGVARTLVNNQSSAGYWYGHNYTGEQFPLETAFAINMLNRTVFAAGAPVAVATATPNPISNGASVLLSGQNSFHQDSTKSIVKWEWDLAGGFNFTESGVKITRTFSTVGPYPKNLPVRLRVTDNGGTTADTLINITVTNPPSPPTANAGGPYNFCTSAIFTPYYLDGSKSVDPDVAGENNSVPAPAIVSWEWDLDGNNVFGDVTGAKPRVDQLFAAKAGTTFNISLKVTDRDNLSFPSAGLSSGNTNIATTQVTVRNVNDVYCTGCVTNAVVNAKRGTPTSPAEIQLTWGPGANPSIDHWNIYRAVNSNGGPYTMVATKTLNDRIYIDKNVSNGNTYYYRISPALLNDTETCQSNQTFTAVLTNR